MRGGTETNETGRAGDAGLPIDYLAIGHVTLDRGADGTVVPGGSVTYAAACARALGARAAIVTCAADDPSAWPALAGVAVARTGGPCTTAFANAYAAGGTRRGRLLARAPGVTRADVPASWRRVGVLHLAPVMDELRADLAGAIVADFVGVTAQGWLRRARRGRRVEQGGLRAPVGLLRRADAVVVSDEDVTGAGDVVETLRDVVPLVVLTHGTGGATAWGRGRTWRQAAFPARVVDPTGAGDTFAAAFLLRCWEGASPAEALRFAAAAAAFAVERQGPGGVPSRDAVIARAAGASTDGEWPPRGRLP